MRPAGLAVLAAALALALLWGPLHALACAVTGAQAYQATSAEVGAVLDVAAAGRMGAEYPALPLLESGYPTEERIAAPVPCVLLKAIAHVESSWRQALGSVPPGSSGPVKQSASCGYGIMQITSGMREPGQLPAETQARIAADYRFNIGWGAQLLAAKWNAGDFSDAIVGDRNPAIAEHWYYAVWAYNQFNFRNNPNNPDFPAGRSPYNGTQSRTNYPYQELVWGLAANPPREGGKPLWEPAPLTLPARELIGEAPKPIPEPAPSYPGACRVLSTEPFALEVGVAVDGPPVTRPVMLAGAGEPERVAWQLAPPPVSWLRVTPTAGSGLPARLTVQVDPRGLPPGVHRTSVGLHAPGGGYAAGQLLLVVRVDAPVRFFFPWVPRRAR